MSLLDSTGVINGDIWCNGAFDFESPLKDLLDSGEYTLEQLLAEDELLQELRGVHPQLIDFFSSEEAVAGLIQYIILPPFTEPVATMGDDNYEEELNDKASAEDSDHKHQKADGEEQQGVEIDSDLPACKTESDEVEGDRKFKVTEPGNWLDGHNTPEKGTKSASEEKDNLHIRFPYMACEVICCEIKGVIDILVDGKVPLLCYDYSNDIDGEDEVKKRKRLLSKLISNDERGKPILDLLFSIFYDSEIGEMDDYRAGYFEKVLSVLFRYRPKDVARYFNEGGGKGNVSLMSAMFKHLYSHSLMQIIQRLLLPQPPLPLPNPEGGESEVNDEANECEDLFTDTLEGADIDPIDSFRCNWSESEVALQMLLEYLIEGNMNANVQDGNYDKEELDLDLYQNTSEILITIIQNSPLTSQTMRALTTDPSLGKLISASTLVEEGSEFSRHDSRLTCAMNVLESLILQLGGYGSVCTMLYEGEGQSAFESAMDELISGDHNNVSEDLGGINQCSTTRRQQAPQVSDIKNYATPETLINHLPKMMASLSNLLAYPGAEEWKSPMQFSKLKSQKILGSSRLRIVRLLESLVLLGNKSIDSLLCESSCLEVCLDLFWKFQWCSMLHQSVANLLVHAFEGQNSRSELQSYFIVRCNLLGRLMYSFWEKEVEGNITSIITASNVELSESVIGHKDSDSDNSPTLSSVVSAKESGSTNDILPVSDDDVDAAIEQQEDGVTISNLQDTGQSKCTNEINKTESGSIVDHPENISSFRLGYMGHVIIICQALVHACIEENENDPPTVEGTTSLRTEMISEQVDLEIHLGGDNTQELLKMNEESYPDDYTSADGDTLAGSLILARLVKKHPLGKIWNDFVLTTLASETALQTTPLGGFQAPSLGTDPLHMHRPGLEDDCTYDDDDGDAPTLPQRGLLVDGGVIDMDDNDLEVAATMMAGLNLGQVAGNHGDTHSQSNSSHKNGYLFDDPLGGERFGDFDDNDKDSSSDEEPEIIGKTSSLSSTIVDGVLAENEAPVMDLFAGNFDAFDESDQSAEPFSDFANFDDAFAGTQTVDDDSHSEEKNKFDSIFLDDKSHDILLDELDKPLSHENGFLSTDNPTTDDSQTDQLGSD